MPNTYDITVVGSCMVDFVSYTSRLPKPGETVHGTEFATNFGGKGANQCVAASKLGSKCAMVARVGADIWGEKYIKNLSDNHIDTTQVRITPNQHTGIAQIIVSETGSNQIVIVAGANTQLDNTDLEYAQNIVVTAKVVICQLETSVNVAIEALKLTKGISILNGAPGLSDYDSQLISLPSIFCVNEMEAALFTGIPVQTTNFPAEAIKVFLEKGCKTIIITLGNQGAFFASYDRPDPIHVECPKVKAVDTTGAGDAFIGALAHVLATREDLSMEKAVKFACFVASDSTKRPGTQISFPGSEIIPQVMNYLQE